ncbi:MAG: hypothetical protein HYV99_01180 [Betaproteobacteria bacterium]|nr:hypothetical protein [Betaproteobacteria bacterium]
MRLPTGSARSTGRPRHSYLPGSTMVLARSGRNQSGRWLPSTIHPHLKFRQGSTGRRS